MVVTTPALLADTVVNLRPSGPARRALLVKLDSPSVVVAEGDRVAVYRFVYEDSEERVVREEHHHCAGDDDALRLAQEAIRDHEIVMVWLRGRLVERITPRRKQI